MAYTATSLEEFAKTGPEKKDPLKVYYGFFRALTKIPSQKLTKNKKAYYVSS